MRGGVDAHLYVCESDPIPNQPGSDGSDIPEWVHFGQWYSKQAFRFPWKAEITKELKKYDVTFVSGNGPIFSQWTGKPSLFYATGGDFTVLPFPVRFRHTFRSFKHFRNACIKAFWQRLGLLRMQAIYGYPFSPYLTAAKKLGVNLHKDYLPIAFDTSLFENSDPWPEEVQKLRSKWNFLLFHPSRMLIKQDPKLVETGQWKQNDLLIKGFAKFIKENRIEDAALVIPDTSLSVDIDLAKGLIRQLKIEDNIVFLKTSDGKAFQRKDLIPYYQACDTVADDFGVGWFGSIVCEGLACGKPVLCYVDNQIMDRLYPWNPIISAGTEEQIVDCLIRLYENKDGLADRGRKGVEWIKKFHSIEGIQEKYLQALLNSIEDFEAFPSYEKENPHDPLFLQI